jgi:tripartite-type tricarboxylate transporter receptor subunit TctC
MWFEQSGSSPGIQSPQAFADFIRVEHTRLGQLIRDAGLRAE